MLERARTAPPAQIVFVGDSITEGWEGAGREIWEQSFAPLGAVNLGVGGDRTEHVLWRLAEAPLARLNPKLVVLLIGTNNLGHGRDNADGTLAGVKQVISTIRTQVPNARLAVMAIFPRGDRMNAMRGDLLQVNQALAAATRDDAQISLVDCGAMMVQRDGTIDTAIMPDALHLSPKAYGIWAKAIAPLLPPRLP